MTNKWLFWLRANDNVILDHLENLGKNLVEASNLFVELLAEYDTLLDEKKSQIKDLEHKGDEITHNLFNILSQTFVTPIDREDLSGLASTIDQVLDYVDGTADRFLLFKIKKPRDDMLDLAKVLLLSSKEIHLLLSRLRSLKNYHELLVHCKNIKKYEHDADAIYRKAIAELFESKDAIEILKLKEIYQNLESSLDKCQDVADIFEDIALKYG